MSIVCYRQFLQPRKVIGSKSFIYLLKLHTKNTLVSLPRSFRLYSHSNILVVSNRKTSIIDQDLLLIKQRLFIIIRLYTY